MKVELLNKDRLVEFTEFCVKYRSILDESYLGDEEFENFDIDHENITYIAVENHKIVGVCSIMVSDYFHKGKKSRYRIFYCEDQSLETYQALHEKILEHVKDYKELFLFIKEDHSFLQEVFQKLNYRITRYSFTLAKDNEVKEVNFPQDYNIRPLVFNRDEEKMCHVVNSGFKNLSGHISDVTVNRVQDMRNSNSFIEEGLRILYHQEEAIGIIAITNEEYNGEAVACIGPISILPEYQKKGLGKNLLRHGVNFSHELGYNKTILTVNAENEKAVDLYLKEGFIKLESVICYTYFIEVK